MKQFDVIIIGSGPAGNTAAIYTVRNGYSTALFTGMSIGGQLTITTEVENFPGFESIKGLELMNKMLVQCEKLGANIFYETITKVDFSNRPFICENENGDQYLANNIIIATGANAKWLGLESEKKFLGYGVSGCATCDGNFFKNKEVAVIGGGDTAAIEALHMSNIASKVYLIYRRSDLTKMQEHFAKNILSNEKIKVIFNSEVVEVCGNEQPKYVTYLKIINNQTKQITQVDVSAMFVAIGRTPENTLIQNSNLLLDEYGYIITKPDSTRTNIKYVYAAGDIVNKKYKQAVIAASYGCIAALEIEEDNK